MTQPAPNDTVAFDTEVLEPLDSTAAAETPAAAGADRVAPPKKRRRWLGALIAIGVIVLVAGGGELALRQIIPNVIANSIRDSFGLGKDHPVYTELGGSALLPALIGRVNDVEVTVPDVQVFDNIETTLFARADSMPFDPTKGAIVGGKASATIPASSMDAVVALATKGFVDEGTLVDDGIEVGRTMKIFGFDVPLSATLGISVEDGALLIEPHSIKAAGFDLTADRLRELLVGDAAVWLGTHTVCIEDQMPRGIELTGLELHTGALGSSATITADLAPDVLSNPEMQEPGSCEP